MYINCLYCSAWYEMLCNISYSQDDQGNTPLKIASQEGHVVNCALLIKWGANVDYQNKVGPLYNVLFFIESMEDLIIPMLYSSVYWIYTILINKLDNIPYSRKIWRGIKFGSLAVCLCNRQIKICQYSLLLYIRMAIPYQTAKFKSANIFAMVILNPTAKFNSRQYFRLYGC